ncbi:MAG TPA: hypothetical protein VKY65_09970 [Alphaproteobacteria bacterium]|nr:hypothetical protein [Alphaproteobacteria bacterium]
MISAKSNVFSGISALGSRLPVNVGDLPSARPNPVEAAQPPTATSGSGGESALVPPPFFPALMVEPRVVESEEEKSLRKARAAYQRRLAAREGLDYLAGRSVDEEA